MEKVKTLDHDQDVGQVQTLDDLLLRNPHGLEDKAVALLRQKLPPAFLLSPLTKQTRDWLAINKDVLDCWLRDRGDRNDLDVERLESDVYHIAGAMVSNQLERAALLNDRECAGANQLLELPL